MITLKILGSPTLLRRLTAMFYDCWLVAGCLLAGSAIINGLRVYTAAEGSLEQGKIALNSEWEIALFLLSLSILWGFFCYFWMKSGQTLGMQTWRMRIDSINNDGIENQRINAQQATIRLAVAFISFGFFGLGYFWCLIDKNKQTWHDKASNSQLVFLEKRQEK